ncbi:MAG: redoxin domain-containing protein [Opitutae bacterium]|nr:redoxin domain-containing protein [Opitutae bacterium]
MKQIIFILASVLFISCSYQLIGEPRTWTSSTGSTVNAELIDFSNRIVILKSSSGGKITLKINQLTPPDQSFIREWVAQKNKLKLSSKFSLSKNSDNQKNPKLSNGMSALIPTKLLNSKGKKVSSEFLAGKIIGFYFSAHWCPPCRAFTPKLVQFRDNNNNDFEVVFVSSDKSPEAQMNYMNEMKMKWFTLPHRSEEANKLSQKYGVRGIPALIIVSPDGEIISKNGRSELGSNSKDAIKNWKKSS